MHDNSRLVLFERLLFLVYFLQPALLLRYLIFNAFLLLHVGMCVLSRRCKTDSHSRDLCAQLLRLCLLLLQLLLQIAEALVTLELFCLLAKLLLLLLDSVKAFTLLSEQLPQLLFQIVEALVTLSFSASSRSCCCCCSTTSRRSRCSLRSCCMLALACSWSCSS